MKALRYLLMSVAMIPGALAPRGALAETIVGKVKFVGVIEELREDDIEARFRVRVDGICGAGPGAITQWIYIRSGALNPPEEAEAHGISMRNAYTTLMAALLADKDVQIEGLPNCNTNPEVLLPKITVGMLG